MFSRGGRKFILNHYFASKSFAAVRETYSNAYPDKEIPSKTAIHRLVTQFRVDDCLRERGEKFQHLLHSFCVKIFYEIEVNLVTLLY